VEKFYRALLAVAVAVSVVCYAAIPLLLLIPNPPKSWPVTAVAGGLALAFAFAGLMLRGISGGELRLPCSKSLHGRISVGVTIIALTWMIVGIVRWPAAPIRQVGNTFRDKRGTVHDRDSYNAFRRWEATLPLAWLPFALVATTALPAVDANRRLRTRD
jgi:hypothetical protein